METKNVMDYITFKQFIYTINIRDCYTNVRGKDIEDNEIIRVHWTKDGEFKKDNYIDIGWYDYFNKDTVWDIIKNTLNENVLNSKVTDFRFNEDYGCIEVWLQNNVYENLQEYQN